jgi:hypothetical protein
METYSKARRLRTLLVFAGTTLTLALLSGDSSDAQTAPVLSFVTTGDEPLTVELEENEDADLLGTVDAVLLNDSDYEGPLTIEFIARESGEVTALGEDSEFPEDRLGFFTTGSAQPTVESFATIPIPLRFGADKAFVQQPVEGVVVARAADGTAVRPATLQVEVMPPEVTSRWAEARFEPASVTIIATRWWPTPLRGMLPWWSFKREGPVWIRDVGSGENITAGETLARTQLSSDTGGSSTLALVTQADLPEQEQQEVEGILEATDISRAGTYSGSLALAPAVESSPKTTVTLKARDFFLWPLLALLGGAALAWWLIKRRDQGRPKKLLLSELKKAFETYREQKKANPNCTYHMSGVFPKAGGWMSCEDLSDDRPKAQIAFCEIGTAKTKEDFDKVVVKVRDIQELVALWPQLCQSAKELENVLKDLPEDVPIRRETKRILAKEELPADTKAMKDFLELYLRQIQAVKRWMQGHKLWNSGKNLYETLRTREMLEMDKAQLNDNDPEVLYKVYLEPAVSLDDLTKPDVIARLRESIYVTMALNRAYPPPTDDSGEAVGAMQEAQDALKEAKAPLAPMQPSDITQGLARALLAYVPSEEIVSMVRVHDKWDFVVTASLTMLAFLVTLYVSTTFGSIWQYLGAFLAGATGQLLINWALLPWYRSYKVASSTPPKPAMGSA